MIFLYKNKTKKMTTTGPNPQPSSALMAAVHEVLMWPVVAYDHISNDISTKVYGKPALAGYAEIAAALGAFYYMQGGFRLDGSYMELGLSYLAAGAAFTAVDMALRKV